MGSSADSAANTTKTSRTKIKKLQVLIKEVAGWTGLEPAASSVTGRRYNQLNYHPLNQGTLSDREKNIIFPVKMSNFLRSFFSIRNINENDCHFY